MLNLCLQYYKLNCWVNAAARYYNCLGDLYHVQFSHLLFRNCTLIHSNDNMHAAMFILLMSCSICSIVRHKELMDDTTHCQIGKHLSKTSTAKPQHRGEGAWGGG